jgi:hypothetical protein
MCRILALALRRRAEGEGHMPGDGQRDFEPPTPPVPGGRDGLFGSGKKIGLVLAGCGLVLLAIAGFYPPARDIWLGYEIDVSKPALQGNWLSGSFQFRRRLFGSTWNGMGGACAVADIADLVPANHPYKGELVTQPCTTQDQCNPAGAAQHWYGYCVPVTKDEGRCWYKPVEGDNEIQVCRRSIDYDPKKIWNLGEVNKLPDPNQASRFNVQDFYRDNTGGKAANWKLIGLLLDKKGQPHSKYGDSAKLP